VQRSTKAVLPDTCWFIDDIMLTVTEYGRRNQLLFAD